MTDSTVVMYRIRSIELQSAAMPWVNDQGQHRQQARKVISGVPGKVSKMANGRINR